MPFLSPFKIIFSAMLLLLLSACGGGSSHSGFPSSDCGASNDLCVASLEITPKFAGILAGETKRYQAIATLTDGSEQDISDKVTWSIDKDNIATLSADASTGQVVATGIASGVTIISAAYRTLQANAHLSVGVTSFTITPAFNTVLTGMTQRYRAFAVLSNGLQYDITNKLTWSVDDINIATLSVTDEQVIATALTVGSAIISATYNGHTITANLDVINEVPDTLIIAPISEIIPVGTTQQYNAFLTTQSGVVVDVTENVRWSITGSNIASIDDQAVVSALSVGTSALNATLIQIGTSLNATATINVSSGTLNKLTISPVDGQFAVGRAGVYRAYAYYSDGNVVDVTRSTQWEIADNTIGHIVPAGIFAGDAIALSPGTTTIQASFSGSVVTTNVEVTDAVIKSISISPVDATSAQGIAVNYQAFGLYSGGSKRDITQLVDWSSSDVYVANIESMSSNAGTAHTLSVGTTTISAGFDGLTQTTALTVTNASITEIIISPQDVEIPVGFTGKFTATAYFSDKSSQDVTRIANWIVDDYSIAAVIPAGETAGQGRALAQGSTILTVTVDGLSAQTNITVTSATLSSLELLPAIAEVPAGTTQQYQLFGLFSDGSSKDFTEFASYQSSNPGSTSIDDKGLATVHFDSGDDITIAATYNGDSATAILKVTSSLLDHLEITPASQTIPVGHKGRLQVRAVYTDGKAVDINQQAIWSVSDGNIASVDNTDAHSGVVLGIGVGEVTVTASYQGQIATNITKVTAATLTSVSISPATTTLPAGASQQYHLIALFSDGSSKNVSSETAWQSSDINTASIDNSGLALAQQIGGTTITGSYDGMTASANLTVTNPALQAIQITPVEPSRPLHSKGQFTAIAFYANGDTSDITQQATWASSAPFVISIYTSGSLAGGVSADKLGSSDISVSFSGLTSTTTATVTNLLITKLILTPVEADVPVGSSQQYHLFALYSDGSSENITAFASFQSSDSNSTSIDENGLATVHYDSGDEITITATYSSESATATIHVTSALLDRLEITPATQTIAVGNKSRLQVRAFYSDGKIIDLNRQATWSLDDYNIASVGNDSDDHAGVVLGLSAGTVTVTASYQGKTATNTTHVSAATLDHVVINPANETVPVGISLKYQMFAIYSDSSSIDVTSSTSWQSTDSSIAIINNQGLANAKNTGATDIKGTYQEISASAPLTVVGATITAIQITPAVSDVAVGSQINFTAIASFSDNTTRDITTHATWLSNDAAVVSIITVGANGGQASALNAGSTEITAELEGISSNSAAVVVQGKGITDIQITPNDASYIKGQIQQYTVWVIYDDSSSKNITAETQIRSDDPLIASFDSHNIMTAVGLGDSEISTVYQGVTSEREFVHVQLAHAPVVPSLQITPANSSIAIGGGVNFTAVLYLGDNAHNDVTNLVTWLSSDTDKVTIVTSGENAGQAHAATVGTANISATLIGVASNIATVEVTGKSLVSIDISVTNDGELIKGTKAHYKAYATYSDESVDEITLAANWKSSDTAIATVLKGDVFGVDVGSTKISIDFEGETDEKDIIVTGATVTSLAITPSYHEMDIGSQVNYIVIATLTDGSRINVTNDAVGSSSDPDLIDVIHKEPQFITIEAIASGTAVLTASFEGKNATADLNIFSASITLDSIAITPLNETINVLSTLTYQALAHYSDGSAVDISGDASWSSDDTSIATINYTSGVSTGVSAGSTSINAYFSGLSASTSLTVMSECGPGKPLTAFIIPDDATLSLNTQMQYNLYGVWTDGCTANLTKNNAASWSSADSSIVSIGKKDAIALAKKVGNTTIHADYQNVIATPVTITVPVNEEVLSVTIQPAPSATINQGATQAYTCSARTSVNGVEQPEKFVTGQARFSSSQTDIATVGSNNGTAQTVNAKNMSGNSTITCFYGGKISSSSLIVQ